MIDLFCIAATVFLEARGEGPEGMAVVADVIAERVERGHGTPCEVVRAEGQFAYDLGALEAALARGGAIERQAMAEALLVAGEVLAGDRLQIGATHFYSGAARPYWATDDNILGAWGGHVLVDIDR